MTKNQIWKDQVLLHMLDVTLCLVWFMQMPQNFISHESDIENSI